MSARMRHGSRCGATAHLSKGGAINPAPNDRRPARTIGKLIDA